jgi:hypothetical protein
VRLILCAWLAVGLVVMLAVRHPVFVPPGTPAYMQPLAPVADHDAGVDRAQPSFRRADTARPRRCRLDREIKRGEHCSSPRRPARDRRVRHALHAPRHSHRPDP